MKRYINPRKKPPLKNFQIKFKNAESLAKEINLEENTKYDVVVDGSFVFGDFIEAFIVDKNYHVKNLFVQTLSYNENNVDSLKNLQIGEYVDNIDIIISAFFFSHERHNLIKYTYEQLDNKNNNFQLSVVRSHCKITLIKTHCNKHIVIQGSANLRSSDNIEQFTVEENLELYNFYNQIQLEIISKFKTINKYVTHKDLTKWHSKAVNSNQREIKQEVKKLELEKNQKQKKDKARTKGKNNFVLPENM